MKLDKSKIALLTVFFALLFSCADENIKESSTSIKPEEKVEKVVTYNSESMAAEIEKIEGNLQNPSIPNKEAERKKLVMFYEDYFNLFSNTTAAPEMLFKAGNESVNLQNYQEAIRFYQLVEKHYQGYQKRPECVYLQGFIYDTYTNELGKAKEKYEYLIERYPKHVLAEQAQLSIDNMGKSDEELIRAFEKNNSN